MADFPDFTFGSARLPPRASRAVGQGPALAELLSVVHHLARRPAGAFRDVSDVARGGALSATALRALRDCFIELVDDELQALYRQRLAAEPAPAGRAHDEKIAGLHAARPAAARVLASFDWPWLVRWLRLGTIGDDVPSCLDRLSNFAFAYKRVNLRFTYHCNIACRHCYNNSGPAEKGRRLALDTMLGIVAEMPGAGIGALNLTGGEPFLYPDDVLALVRAARAARLPEVSIYTNGFWAGSPGGADAMLDRLAGAGFGGGPGDHLKVSGGAYHQEFIPFDRLVTLGHRYHAAFDRPLHVDLEIARDEGPTEGDLRGRLTEAGLADRLVLQFRRVERLGRGRTLEVAGRSPIDRPCRIIDAIVFDPDGTARPCCGFNNENHGVRIGRTAHSLRQLIKRMQNDPVLQFLATNPMSDIFRHVDARRNLLGYAGPCELCQHAIGGLHDKEALQATLFDGQRFYPFWFGEDDLVVTSSGEPSGATKGEKR